MIAFCRHEKLKKHGKDSNGHQRYRCCACGITQVDTSHRLLGDMRLPTDKAVFVLKLLLEGTSIRTAERLTGVNRNTIMDLLVLVGRRCERFWTDRMRNLKAKDVQCDEIWGFVGMKERTRKRLNLDSPTIGDVYVYIGIERTTKLVLAYHCGKRDTAHTEWFTQKLAAAVSNAPQITTDGWAPYQNAIPHYFGGRRGMDYAALVKVYAALEPRGEGRYSPPQISAIKKERIWGNPDADRVCTSHVERQNLSIRMAVRRMTRLTNGFSKKWINHTAAMALWLVWYNFGRVHMTLKKTPAMAHRLADHPWTVEELLAELNTYQYDK